MNNKPVGRPKVPDAKRKRFEIRLTEAEEQRLSKCANSMSKTKANTLLYGLELIEAELQKAGK